MQMNQITVGQWQDLSPSFIVGNVVRKTLQAADGCLAGGTIAGALTSGSGPGSVLAAGGGCVIGAGLELSGIPSPLVEKG
ncbi:MAG: hypothetical protein ACREDR_37645, partial [Blastocatellia bacterium]